MAFSWKNFSAHSLQSKNARYANEHNSGAGGYKGLKEKGISDNDIRAMRKNHEATTQQDKEWANNAYAKQGGYGGMTSKGVKPSEITTLRQNSEAGSKPRPDQFTPSSSRTTIAQRRSYDSGSETTATQGYQPAYKPPTGSEKTTVKNMFSPRHWRKKMEARQAKIDVKNDERLSKSAERRQEQNLEAEKASLDGRKVERNATKRDYGPTGVAGTEYGLLNPREKYYVPHQPSGDPLNYQ